MSHLTYTGLLGSDNKSGIVNDENPAGTPIHIRGSYQQIPDPNLFAKEEITMGDVLVSKVSGLHALVFACISATINAFIFLPIRFDTYIPVLNQMEVLKFLGFTMLWWAVLLLHEQYRILLGRTSNQSAINTSIRGYIIGAVAIVLIISTVALMPTLSGYNVLGGFISLTVISVFVSVIMLVCVLPTPCFM